MKNIKTSTYTFCTIILSIFLVLNSCSEDFLEEAPIGVYDENAISNKNGIEGLLINAYASLDGNYDVGSFFSSGASNWIYGSMNSGEAYRGSTGVSDQAELNFIMQWDTPVSSTYISGKFSSIFDGIGRANEVLKFLGKVEDPDLTQTERTRIEAEVRFIRAFQHFEGKKVFGNIPFVDETITDYKIPNFDESGNYINIWPQIEADFQFGYDNLEEVMPDLGRVNKWAAAAFLAKAYLYQNKFAEAKVIFDDIILNGKTSSGESYALFPNFQDNFRINTQNGSETILGIQFTVDASTGGFNGNYDGVLNYPQGIAGGTNSWFFRPSQNIVNSFRTGPEGLPLLDTYNSTDVTSNEFIADSDSFIPYQDGLDPRLDHSVGRRGIPYLDWGMMTGNGFAAGSEVSITLGGPYTGKKHVFSSSELENNLATKVSWGYYANALNYAVMRYSDLLLMAAECEVELNNLDTAKNYVNLVRSRASNSKLMNEDGSDFAANYNVEPYISFSGQDDARKAVRFERKLELALEGHRFFDLVRWETAEQFINTEFLPVESGKRPAMFPSGCCAFNTGKDEYQPIPEFAITQSSLNGEPTLKQNPGY